MKKADPIALADLIQTVSRLRAPDGCPWDREQTHLSLRPYLLEEAYEVLHVLDQIDSKEKLTDNAHIRDSLKEELGDLLLQVLLHSEMTEEVKAFNIYDVAQTLNEKLIRRHPHVFGDKKAKDADAAYQNWEKQKAEERKNKPKSSVLDGLPPALPQLQRAYRLLEKVTQVGFQWPSMEGPLAKLDEEIGELKEVIQKFDAQNSEHRKELEHELGDVLFCLANVAYLLKSNPEDALRTTLSRFERRFRYVEQKLKEKGSSPEKSTLDEMDFYWNEAKKLEN